MFSDVVYNFDCHKQAAVDFHCLYLGITVLQTIVVSDHIAEISKSSINTSLHGPLQQLNLLLLSVLIVQVFSVVVFVIIWQLQRTNPFVIGDSSKDNTRAKMDEFCSRLQKVILLQKSNVY